MNHPDITELRRRLATPDTRRSAAIDIGDWTRDLCLMFGTPIDLAFTVGGLMAEGVRRTWEEKEAVRQ